MILWHYLPAYIVASIRELIRLDTMDVIVVRRRALQGGGVEHPYDPSLYAGLELITLAEMASTQSQQSDVLFNILEDYAPDITLVAGWSAQLYAKAAAHLRRKGCLVIGAMDNQWRGSLRQRVATLPIGRFSLHRLFDVLWVPGERTAEYARKLGYTEFDCRGTHRTIRGLYTCDTSLFWPVARQRFAQKRPGAGRGNHCLSDSFLYLGRFMEHKGLIDLMAAYSTYRERVQDPWELVCVGGGPLEGYLRSFDGVIVRSFIQPPDLPKVMKESSVFILPSRFEPWGVVVHEATASGMAIIASTAVGSATDLVRPGHNGVLFPPGDVAALTQHMVSLSNRLDRVMVLGVNSFQISSKFTPQQWARTLHSLAYSQ